MFGNERIFLIAALLCLAWAHELEVDAVNGIDILHIQVGQAESELIVAKGATKNWTMLIDCPEENWQSGKLAALVAERLRSVTGGTMHVDVGMASHLHLDHIGYVGYGGFWALVTKHGVKFDKFIDRDHGVWRGGSSCTEDDITWHNVGTLSGTATNWVCWMTDKAAPLAKVRTVAKVCSEDQVAPPTSQLRFRIVAADAIGARTKDGRAVGGDHHMDALPPSENDYSLGLLLKYGSFSYATFGDLDGQYTSSSFGYIYDDIESTVAPRVGEVDVYQVNHHGSEHSSNQYFVNALNPRVSVISVGQGNSYGHPTQVVVDRLNSKGDLYLTERGNPNVYYGPAIIANGDVTIRVTPAGKTYTVVAGSVYRTYTSKGTPLPPCSV